MNYTSTYIDDAKKILEGIDQSVVEKMADTLVDIRNKKGRVFFIGSGGGAGHASHAVCDFRKIAGIECYSPSDNVSELTARVNDDGWETSYANFLITSRLGANDGVFVFSVGGGNAEKQVSMNLVACMQLAQKVGAKILGVVGRDGGYAGSVGDAVLVLPQPKDSDVTTHTEAFQALVWHMLVAHPKVKQSEMKWESITA